MPLTRPAPSVPASILGFLLTLLALGLSDTAQATPQYAARAGRACDNCHLTPNKWKDPSLAKRKCTLSCQGCHVDPSGGGMRTVAGRFYGQATRPMIATSPRPTADWDRGFPGLGRKDKATTYSHTLPQGPGSYEQSAVYADSLDDRFAWGLPGGQGTRYGFLPGRYFRLNPDPVFRIGGDLRLATLLSGSLLAFPMQLDIPFTFHPVHHFTLYVNTGARGRRGGYKQTFDNPATPYFREAFVMLHEAPYQSYLKAGRFVPSFGLRLDDHTTRTRRGFGLDGALPESRVTGVEAGAAPNHPFIQASYFRMTSTARQPAQWDIFDVDQGWGSAVNAGIRKVGWGAGASWMIRRRPLEEGGDTGAYGGYVTCNPWKYFPNVPLTYQAEFDYGTRHRSSGTEVKHSAFYQELDWALYNGFDLLVAHDWEDPDHAIRDDASNRVQFGAIWTPIPGVTLDTRIRVLIPQGVGGTDADLFIQLHLWN